MEPGKTRLKLLTLIRDILQIQKDFPVEILLSIRPTTEQPFQYTDAFAFLSGELLMLESSQFNTMLVHDTQPEVSVRFIPGREAFRHGYSLHVQLDDGLWRPVIGIR
jgi:hypothetical protein